MITLLLACVSANPSTSDDTDLPDGHDSGEPLPDADEQQNNTESGPGQFAADFLSASTYTKLTIEVDYVVGQKPDADALNHLVDVLGTVCDKPDGISVVLDDEIPSQGSPSWSIAAAEAVELAWRDRYRDPDSGEAVLYFLYLDGHSDKDTDDGRILGYAYRGSSLVMLKTTIDDAGSGLLGLGADIEPTVLCTRRGTTSGSSTMERRCNRHIRTKPTAITTPTTTA
jgi:hypothetical protein